MTLKYQQMTNDDFEVLGWDLEEEIVNVAITASLLDHYFVKEVDGVHFVIAGALDAHYDSKYMVLWHLKDFVDAIKSENYEILFRKNAIMMLEGL